MLSSRHLTLSAASRRFGADEWPRSTASHFYEAMIIKALKLIARIDRGNRNVESSRGNNKAQTARARPRMIHAEIKTLIKVSRKPTGRSWRPYFMIPRRHF